MPLWKKDFHLTRLEQFERWEMRTMDLTWYCVPCYRQLMRMATDDEAAVALDFYLNNDQRKVQTEKWLRNQRKKGNANT